VIVPQCFDLWFSVVVYIIQFVSARWLAAGTVCVLGTADANGEAALLRVIQRYAKETAHEPKVFCGTSPGAAHFGVLRVKRRRL
jgi:hypothetical protein